MHSAVALFAAAFAALLSLTAVWSAVVNDGSVHALPEVVSSCEVLEGTWDTAAEDTRPVPEGNAARFGVEAAWEAYRSALQARDYEGAASLVHPWQGQAAQEGRGEYERLRAALMGEEEDTKDRIAEMLQMEFGELLLPDDTEELALVGVRVPPGAGEGVVVWEVRDVEDPRDVLVTRLSRVQWDGTRWALLLPWHIACALGVDLPLPDFDGEASGPEDSEMHAFLADLAQAVAEGDWEVVAKRTDPLQHRWAEANRDKALAGGDTWGLSYDYPDRDEEEIREADGLSLLTWRLEEDGFLHLLSLYSGEDPRAEALVWGSGSQAGLGALVYRTRLMDHPVLEVLPVVRVDGVLHLRLPGLVQPPASGPGPDQ